MKKQLFFWALFVFTNANADTDIIIDKKKNNEILYEQSYLSMGNMEIENFSIKATDSEYVFFEGTNLRHLNSKNKYYDFKAKIKQTPENIQVDKLEMIVNGNIDSTVNVSGIFSRKSLQDSDGFFEILRNNKSFDLSIKNKSNSSNFLSVFKVNNVEKIGSVNESLHIVRDGDIFDVKNISLTIENSFRVIFSGTIRLTENEIEFIDGNIKYDFSSEDELSNKIKNMLHFESEGSMDFKNNIYDLTKYLN
jgi:hypothetical protein